MARDRLSLVTEQEPLERPWWLLPVGRVHARWWALVGVALVAADYLIGSDSQFPVLYVIPVTLAAWYSGRWPAVALAVVVPAFHVVFLMLMTPGTQSAMLLATMTVARAAVIVVMALWFARLVGARAATAALRREARGAPANLFRLQEHPQRKGRVGTARGLHLQPVGRGLHARSLPEVRGAPLLMPGMLHRIFPRGTRAPLHTASIGG